MVTVSAQGVWGREQVRRGKLQSSEPPRQPLSPQLLLQPPEALRCPRGEAGLADVSRRFLEAAAGCGPGVQPRAEEHPSLRGGRSLPLVLESAQPFLSSVRSSV